MKVADALRKVCLYRPKKLPPRGRNAGVGAEEVVDGQGGCDPRVTERERVSERVDRRLDEKVKLACALSVTLSAATLPPFVAPSMHSVILFSPSAPATPTRRPSGDARVTVESPVTRSYDKRHNEAATGL
jgi:hypothetical protein